MKIKVFASALVVIILSGIAPGPATASQDLANTFAGGAVSGDAVLQAKDIPYTITSPIDIPEGASLTINPGVELVAKAASLFRVQGTLVVAGTSQKPVILKVSENFVQTIATASGENAQRIDISFAHITGGRSFDIAAKSFALRDSEIVDQKNCQFGSLNEISISKADTAFARNYFKSVCGFSFNVSFGVFGPRGTFVVENNLFDGNSLGSAWVSVTSIWKDTLTLKGNTFATPTSKVVATGFFKTNVLADGNYWGNLSINEVRKLVDSSVADTFNPALVVLNNVLSAPSSLTPTGQKYNLVVAPTPSPSPTPSATTIPTPTQTAPALAPVTKFKNCAALNLVYKGGVANSANWVNKGGKIKLKPILNSKVYVLNKALDGDKDGIVCER